MKRAIVWALLLLAACEAPAIFGKAPASCQAPLIFRRPLPGFQPELAERVVPQPDVSQEERARVEARSLVMQLDRIRRPAVEGAPNVILIVLDTFRADRLAAYGSERGLTPNLDAFSESATVFTEMISPGTWTLPSHGALFTGRYAIEHGARGAEPGSKTRAFRMREDIPTLAERAVDGGYVTVGVAANKAFLDKTWGLARGFDLWFCRRLASADGISYIQGDRINRLAINAVRYYHGDAPLLLFLNYMDTHTPWIPREGYTANPERIDPTVLPQGGTWQGVGGWGRARARILGNRRAPTQRELDTWEEAYDSEVRYLDARFGELMEGLEKYGIDEQDYIVVLSDHGEYLGEHNLLEHSKDVYDPVTRVPLMIRGPGFGAAGGGLAFDDRPIQTNDVPNILLTAMGLEPLTQPDPDEELQVTELYWSRSRDRKYPEVAERFDRIRRGFRDADEKLVLSSDGDEAAFDLGADPGEESSILGEAAWEDEMRLRAEAWLSRREATTGDDVELTDEQEAALRALGYID